MSLIFDISDTFWCLFQTNLPPVPGEEAGIAYRSKEIVWQVPTLRHRLGEGLFSILQIVYVIKTKIFSVQNLKLYCFHKWKTLSFWYYAIPTMYFLRTNPSSIYSLPVRNLCEFCKQVLSWLRKNDIDVGELKEADLIFGKFDIKDDFTLINHILLLGNHYIYSRKCQNAKPSLKGFQC